MARHPAHAVRARRRAPRAPCGLAGPGARIPSSRGARLRRPGLGRRLRDGRPPDPPSPRRARRPLGAKAPPMTARRLGPVLRDLCVAWSGATMVAPRLTPRERGRLAMRFARRTLRSLGVRVTVRGTALPADEPALIVANHVSWLDVYILNTLVDARFVAKSEVAAWPVVGGITRGFDAIFIVRDSARDAARVKTAVAAALRAGDRVVVFPEATT